MLMRLMLKWDAIMAALAVATAIAVDHVPRIVTVAAPALAKADVSKVATATA